MRQHVNKKLQCQASKNRLRLLFLKRFINENWEIVATFKKKS